MESPEVIGQVGRAGIHDASDAIGMQILLQVPDVPLVCLDSRSRKTGLDANICDEVTYRLDGT